MYLICYVINPLSSLNGSGSINSVGIGTGTDCGGGGGVCVLETKSEDLFWQNYYQVLFEGQYKAGFP